MSATEYVGIITSVEATSSHVKVQLDTAPGKTLTWLMTQFIHKPRPEVGKRLICTAQPGPHNELHVQQLISITDAVSTEIQQAVGKDVGKPVSTEITPDPTTLPLPSSMTTIGQLTEPSSTLDQLAEKILKLKVEWKEAFESDLLGFKYAVGREISAVRRTATEATYRDLEKLTGIRNDELVRCVQFFEKYPNGGYELKAWRKVIAELPAGKEPTTESKPVLVVDEKHLWTCPECGVKFEHLHNANGKHRLREVEGNTKAD
jgi:hypothetical protein